MELRFLAPDLRRLDETSSEVLACGLFSDERPPHGAVGLLDWRLAGRLSGLMRDGFLVGAPGEVLMVALRPKLPFDKGLIFGLGPRAEFDETAFRRVLQRMLETMEGLCARSATVELPGRHVRAIGAERATTVLLELAADRSGHDTWTLLESPEDQKSVSARLMEQRRRDRRGGI